MQASHLPEESAPIFSTRIRPVEVALLSDYLYEAISREDFRYLREFLEYVSTVVLHSRMDENMSLSLMGHALDQAGATLADIREHGEPWFYRDPGQDAPVQLDLL